MSKYLKFIPLLRSKDVFPYLQPLFGEKNYNDRWSWEANFICWTELNRVWFTTQTLPWQIPPHHIVSSFRIFCNPSSNMADHGSTNFFFLQSINMYARVCVPVCVCFGHTSFMFLLSFFSWTPSENPTPPRVPPVLSKCSCKVFQWDDSKCVY